MIRREGKLPCTYISHVITITACVRLGHQAYTPPHAKTNPLPQIPPCWTSFVNVELQAAESVNLIQENTQRWEKYNIQSFKKDPCAQDWGVRRTTLPTQKQTHYPKFHPTGRPSTMWSFRRRSLQTRSQKKTRNGDRNWHGGKKS